MGKVFVGGRQVSRVQQWWRQTRESSARPAAFARCFSACAASPFARYGSGAAAYRGTSARVATAFEVSSAF